MRDLSDRSLTRAYVVALAIIAAMSAASHVALGHILKEQEGSAVVLNVSGRQRMLSQRIAGSAAELALGVAGSRATLVEALDLFEQSHHDLIAGNPALGLPPVVQPELKTIYFGGAMPLDGIVADFVARGRRLAAMPSAGIGDSTDFATLIDDARAPLIERLEAVVTTHQRISEGQLRIFQWLETSTLVVVLLTLLCEALLIFRPMVTRIAGYTRALVTMASTDHLTGVANRRCLLDRTNAVLSCARQEGVRHPLSMMMIDVDRFKAVNDTYGHAAGDAVLQVLCQTLRHRLRPGDLLGRLGGEEFCVVLPGSGLAGATLLAERLREAVEALAVPVGASTISFTISIGVAAMCAQDATYQTILDQADRAVYQAKAGGRNRVVAAEAPGDAEAEAEAGDLRRIA